jgi:hypothetical protein
MEYRYLLVNKEIINKVLDLDSISLEETIKKCLRDKTQLYRLSVVDSESGFYVNSDAVLMMESIPVHETWVNKTSWPDKDFKVPTVIIELDKYTFLSSLVGKFVGGELKCHKCGKLCNSMSGFTLHRKMCKAVPKSQNGVIFSCSICEKRTVSRFGLTNHLRVVHPELYNELAATSRKTDNQSK